MSFSINKCLTAFASTANIKILKQPSVIALSNDKALCEYLLNFRCKGDTNNLRSKRKKKKEPIPQYWLRVLAILMEKLTISRSNQATTKYPYDSESPGLFLIRPYSKTSNNTHKAATAKETITYIYAH